MLLRREYETQKRPWQSVPKKCPGTQPYQSPEALTFHRSLLMGIYVARSLQHPAISGQNEKKIISCYRCWEIKSIRDTFRVFRILNLELLKLLPIGGSWGSTCPFVASGPNILLWTWRNSQPSWRSMRYKNRCHEIDQNLTAPKFNMEPEHKSLEKESPFGNHYFQVPC